MTEKGSNHLAAETDKLDFSAAEYNAVATDAHLDSINLIAFNFNVDHASFPHQRDWKLSYGRRVTACQYDEEENFVAAIIRFEVVGKHGRRNALKCVAEYGIMYSVPEIATRDAAIAFCRNVGSFAAYPYFRAHVASLGWDAGLKLPPLPSIASTAHIPKRKAKEAA